MDDVPLRTWIPPACDSNHGDAAPHRTQIKR